MTDWSSAGKKSWETRMENERRAAEGLPPISNSSSSGKDYSTIPTYMSFLVPVGNVDETGKEDLDAVTVSIDFSTLTLDTLDVLRDRVQSARVKVRSVPLTEEEKEERKMEKLAAQLAELKKKKEEREKKDKPAADTKKDK